MSQTFTQANALLSVTGLPCGSIGTTTGVDQIAADLLQRPSRQSRAIKRRCRDVGDLFD